MKRTTKQTGLLTICFVLIFLSNSAYSETVFKCKAYPEQGKTFSVVMPDEATEFLVSRNNAGDTNHVALREKIGVGSITLTTWAAVDGAPSSL